MSDMATQAIVLGEKPWWQAYYGVQACSRCGRTEGLRLGIKADPYRLIGCDCNYVHVRAEQRVIPTRPLVLP